MIITTSRKPSPRTRSFVKAFSRFLNWKYVARGKTSLKDLEFKEMCIVSEIKGNPAVMSFYLLGKKKFDVLFTVSNIRKVDLDDSDAIFFGEKYNFFNAIPSKLLIKKVYFPKKIVEKSDELYFYFNEALVFKMRILGIREFDQNL